MWLVSVVIRRYIDILIIIINFPYSTCIRSFLAEASLLLCSFLNVFSVFKNKNKNKNKKPKWRFLTSRGAHVNCAIMAMLYTHPIGNQPQNTMVVFKMRESVPAARYSPVCNVLRQWKTSLILTYRVYRLYDYRVYRLYDIIYFYTCTYERV